MKLEVDLKDLHRSVSMLFGADYLAGFDSFIKGELYTVKFECEVKQANFKLGFEYAVQNCS